MQFMHIKKLKHCRYQFQWSSPVFVHFLYALTEYYKSMTALIIHAIISAWVAVSNHWTGLLEWDTGLDIEIFWFYRGMQV